MKTFLRTIAIASTALLPACASSGEARCANTPNASRGNVSDRDRAAIESAYADWYTAWKTKDHVLAARHYSDDAIWVNAFGTRCVGRQAIQDELEFVFGLNFVMAGDSRTTERTVRFIHPGVALVTSLIERDGQRTASGESLGTRRTSHLRVFQKLGGTWQIVSHLISDARSKERPGR